MRKLIKPILIILISTIFLLVLAISLQGIGIKKAINERDFVFSYLLMDSTSFEEEEYSGEDSNITRVFKGDTGYIVETEVDGYDDKIVVWTGVKNDGYVTGLTIRDMDETLGLGRSALYDVDFLLQFLRTEGDSVVGEDIDALTGATVTSKAIARAVNSSVGFVTGADVTSSATEWGV